MRITKDMQQFIARYQRQQRVLIDRELHANQMVHLPPKKYFPWSRPSKRAMKSIRRTFYSSDIMSKTQRAIDNSMKRWEFTLKKLAQFELSTLLPPHL
jgi:hypothetical protein